MPKPYAKLRGEMLAHGDTAKDVGDVLLVSTACVSHRLNDRQPWTLDEMYALMDRYHIPYGQMHIYFPKHGRHEIC